MFLLTEVHQADSWFDGGEGEEMEAVLSSWIHTTFNRKKFSKSQKSILKSQKHLIFISFA